MSKNFPYSTSIPAKIWGCSLWSRSVTLGSAESEMVRLISREIIFRRIPTYMITIPRIPQRHRRTDRQTTCLGNTALLRVTNERTEQQTDKHLCCDYRPTCACIGDAGKKSKIMAVKRLVLLFITVNFSSKIQWQLICIIIIMLIFRLTLSPTALCNVIFTCVLI